MLKKLNSLIVLFFLLMISACAHIKSGNFIQVRDTDTIKSLAKEFGVSSDEIIRANKGRDFRVGEWFFIPTRVGLAHELKDYIDFGGEYDPSKLPIYTGKLLWPVPSSTKISSRYGKRWGKNHDGIDIPGRKGTAILASEDGKVIYSGNGLKGYGNLIIVAHDNGLRTVYAHNDRNVVSKGSRVVRGQVIGYIGATGIATGPHLHYEVRHYDRPMNPMVYVEKSRKTLVSYKD